MADYADFLSAKAVTVADGTCEWCGGAIEGKGHNGGRFCTRKCFWTWNNRNRRLTPNARFTCIVCRKQVECYISPSRQKRERTMQFCSRTCKGKHQTAENHPRWKGKWSDRDGYVYVKAPEHPAANKDGCVFEHRLVVEGDIGRYLMQEEVVHHKNGDPSDNRIENLQLFASHAEHKRAHEGDRLRDEQGRYLPLLAGVNG